MSILFPPLTVPRRRALRHREIAPGSVGCLRMGDTIGTVWVKTTAAPGVCEEHWIVVPTVGAGGLAPCTWQKLAPSTLPNQQEFTTATDYFSWYASTYGDESSVTYTFVTATQQQPLPTSATNMAGGAIKRARLEQSGQVRGWAFVQQDPNDADRFTEHWALKQAYEPPSVGSGPPVTVQLAPLDPTEDAAILSATTPTAFLAATSAAGCTTYIRGDATRQRGLP